MCCLVGFLFIRQPGIKWFTQLKQVAIATSGPQKPLCVYIVFLIPDHSKLYWLFLVNFVLMVGARKSIRPVKN